MNTAPQLKEGKITLRELSLWFGLSQDNFSRASESAKAKKFKILEHFADFHFEGKSIYIDKVKVAEYSKAYLAIEKEFPKRWGIIKDEYNQVNPVLKKERIDTCARVGAEIWADLPEVNSQISKTTSKQYARKAKVKFYGRNHVKDDRGLLGRCEYVRMNEDCSGPLNEKQLAVFKECQRIAYKDASEFLANVDEDYKKGNITKAERDEAWASYDSTGCHERLVQLVIEKLGFYPELRTKLYDEQYFEDEETSDQKESK